MQLHDLQRKTPQKRKQRVGRGGTRGKTSGRGHKGQKARAGHRIRPEIRDFIKKFPKQRGRGKHKLVSIQTKPAPVNLAQIEAAYEKGETVSPQTLVTKGVVERKGGRLPAVKILGTGALTKAVVLSGVSASAAARKSVEAAGGSVE